jgi:SAM-dependent methyltransferase
LVAAVAGSPGNSLPEGADVTDIDPDATAIRDATTAVPSAKFLKIGAEALPFGEGTFDIATMINALHHVPETAMRLALRHAIRVLVPGGVLIVMEPLVAGNFFAALQMVEDETAVRQATQAAIVAAVSAGDLVTVRMLHYVRRETFDTPEHFLERVVAVDLSRTDVVERNRDAIIAAVTTLAQRDTDGRLVFEQPIKVNVLRSA